MEYVLDAIMGILLGISAFVFSISYLAYRRSGVRGPLLLLEGLVLHMAVSVFIIVAAHVTDWFANVDGVPVVMADAILLGAVLALGFLGGRSGA
jgi:hypothetical protein